MKDLKRILLVIAFIMLMPFYLLMIVVLAIIGSVYGFARQPK